MFDPRCHRRIRIRIHGLDSKDAQQWLERLLLMVEGIIAVKANPTSSRLLIQFDDRKIEAWQISALVSRLGQNDDAWKPAADYALHRHKMFLLLPISISGALLARRVVLGRSRLADNIFVFELATVVSAMSGYPPLRSRVSQLARRLKTNDDLLLSAAALFLAVMRESHLVLATLFWLSYNSFHRRNNTLSASISAGEAVALLDQENREPDVVKRFAARASLRGLVLSIAGSILRRDAAFGASMLLAANPRPAIIGTKFLLNHGEILTHEKCQYIPIHTGMDLYELAAVNEIVCWPHSDHAPELPDRAAEKSHSTPSQLKRIVLVASHVLFPPISQRQGETIYLRGSQAQLVSTLQLSHQLRRQVQTITVLTEAFNVLLITLVLFGVKERRINLGSDVFVLGMLALAEQTAAYD